MLKNVPPGCSFHMIRCNYFKALLLIVNGNFVQGEWRPESRKGRRVTHVAIKILNEGSQPGEEREFTEEARLVASVSHIHCVKYAFSFLLLCIHQKSRFVDFG